jgi:hypothetical protein
MCTVTVVPWEGGLRLACNRDERHTRPAALPPVRRHCGSRWAIHPIDPVGGGTWVAVNNAGLTLALLNVTTRPGAASVPSGEASPSRGTIIPALLACDDLSTAVAAAQNLDIARFPPFRLVLADRGGVAELRTCGERLRLAGRGSLTGPCLFTSSGLGDRLVEGPRRHLFEEWFGAADDWPARQDVFHRHSWPDRPHLSVCMRRGDARTVSYTVVTVGAEAVSLRYHPDAPDRPSEPYIRSLPLLQEVGT